MASQGQSVVNVTSPGTTAVTVPAANGPPLPTLTPLPGPAILTNVATKAQALITDAQPIQSQSQQQQQQQQANNIQESMDKSFSNTLKVCCLNHVCFNMLFVIFLMLLGSCCCFTVIRCFYCYSDVNNIRIGNVCFMFYSVILRWS